jgi:hypothetical protein
LFPRFGTERHEPVAAYACNNTNDEAWFFGAQKDGTMDVTSKYLDRLQASYDGKNLNTTLTVNDVTYTGTASPATPPAGIYTAAGGDARAVWIVHAEQQGFKDKVRQARVQRQLEQSAKLDTAKFRSTLNGATVTASRVTGGMTSASLPS